MKLSHQHRRFLLIDQCVIPTTVNLVINGALAKPLLWRIAWILNCSAVAIPLWSLPSIAVDLIATA